MAVDEPWKKYAEAATELGISENTLSRLVRYCPGFPVVRIGRGVFFNVAEIKAFIRNNEQKVIEALANSRRGTKPRK